LEMRGLPLLGPPPNLPAETFMEAFRKPPEGLCSPLGSDKKTAGYTRFGSVAGLKPVAVAGVKSCHANECAFRPVVVVVFFRLVVLRPKSGPFRL
jgi:hypothetical protein